MLCRLLNNPTMLQAFFIRDGNSWRAPKINETCCARPKLGGLLENVAEKGPDAMNARARVSAHLVCIALHGLRLASAPAAVVAGLVALTNIHLEHLPLSRCLTASKTQQQAAH